jgi:hypothetical protein
MMKSKNQSSRFNDMRKPSRITWRRFAQQLLRAGVLCCCLSLEAASQTNPPPPADVWVTNHVQLPAGLNTNLVLRTGFETLQAEVNVGRLKILWSPRPLNTNASVTLVASADDLSHRRVRDWSFYPMNLQGNHWAARLPVDDVDVPVVYLLRTIYAGETNLSPMRVCFPRMAGLEEPSRIFWPFLEGFEMGAESWSLLASQAEPASLTIDPTAKNGHAALRVSLPAGKRSVTVATTRVRGWQIQQNLATGLRLWLRTREGTGRVRFTLFANAFEPNQMFSMSSIESKLDHQWKKIELPFASFPKLPLGGVDWFTIEFIGTGPREFLIDDLQLLGRWKIEME